MLWGADKFVNMAKIENAPKIDVGDVHFHEFTPREIAHLLRTCGFRVQTHRFISSGLATWQGRVKRVVKAFPVITAALNTHYFRFHPVPPRVQNSRQ